MECSICYNTTDQEENPRIKHTFVTLPCEGTQHLNQKHVLCFHCFIVNHATSHGKCPVCRDNYMEFVGQSHDINMDTMTFADNLSSQIDETEIIMRIDDIVENEFGIVPNQEEEINIIDETFEEFASYLLQNCQYE